MKRVSIPLFVGLCKLQRSGQDTTINVVLIFDFTGMILLFCVVPQSSFILSRGAKVMLVLDFALPAHKKYIYPFL